MSFVKISAVVYTSVKDVNEFPLDDLHISCMIYVKFSIAVHVLQLNSYKFCENGCSETLT
jgi:hypothetical protein